MSSPDKEDVAALTAAGFSRDEIKRWIAPMATSRPRQISDPDGYMWDVEPVDCTEFFTWEYSHEFEHLCDETNANEVPTLKLGALHRRKKLTEDASAVIGKIVLSNRQLFCLNVEFEGDKEILFAFFRHWHGNKCNLQCLEVGSSGFGGTSEFGPFIKRLLKDNTKLVELKLTHTEMTLDDCKDMASAISGSDTLKHLSLMWNRVGDPGAKIISEAVAGMPRMETIDFWGNDIFKYGSIAKMVLGRRSFGRSILRSVWGENPRVVIQPLGSARNLDTTANR